MLSEGERQQIEAHFDRYPQRRAVLPEALKVVQRSRGWVSDEAVGEIAALLELTPDEVDAVATFYNLVFRRPVGRHVILLCDSVSCWIMGSDSLLERLRSRLGIGLGETTQDGRFTLLPASCLGACERAPAMMIDEDLYGPVSADEVDGILGRYS
jgi:NADH-quinone oxidoreductase subunit E